MLSRHALSPLRYATFRFRLVLLISPLSLRCFADSPPYATIFAFFLPLPFSSLDYFRFEMLLR